MIQTRFVQFSDASIACVFEVKFTLGAKRNIKYLLLMALVAWESAKCPINEDATAVSKPASVAVSAHWRLLPIFTELMASLTMMENSW